MIKGSRAKRLVFTCFSSCSAFLFKSVDKWGSGGGATTGKSICHHRRLRRPGREGPSGKNLRKAQNSKNLYLNEIIVGSGSNQLCNPVNSSVNMVSKGKKSKYIKNLKVKELNY